MRIFMIDQDPDAHSDDQEKMSMMIKDKDD